MIYETLAAMADLANNDRLDNDASLFECSEVISELSVDGKLNTNSDVTIMHLSNGKTRITTNVKFISDTYFIHALQSKTPRSDYQEDMDAFDNKVTES